MPTRTTDMKPLLHFRRRFFSWAARLSHTLRSRRDDKEERMQTLKLAASAASELSVEKYDGFSDENYMNSTPAFAKREVNIDWCCIAQYSLPLSPHICHLCNSLGPRQVLLARYDYIVLTASHTRSLMISSNHLIIDSLPQIVPTSCLHTSISNDTGMFTSLSL